MRSWIVGILATSLMMMGSAVSAQSLTPLPPQPEGFTLTPFLGSAFGGDYASSSVAVGAALGYGLTDKVSVEGELAFLPNGSQGQVIQFDTKVWSLSADVLYHFLDTAQRFTPYVAVGLGLAGVNADLGSVPVTTDDTQTKFVWNGGVGVKSALNEHFGVRGDLRYFTGDELVPNYWRIYAGLVIRRIGL